MSSLTTRLRLIKHTVGDRFRTADYASNWNGLDAAPGTHICTSGTRPSDWASDQTGRSIFETDTHLRYYWSGSAFVREGPKGLITRAERLTDTSTASTTFSAVLSTTSASYAARRHLIIAEAPRVYSTAGLTGLALFCDSTMLNGWVHQGATGSDPSDQARPLSFVTTDLPSAGAHVYSLQFRAEVGFSGTSYVEADTNKPCSLTVVEI